MAIEGKPCYLLTVIKVVFLKHNLSSQGNINVKIMNIVNYSVI